MTFIELVAQELKQAREEYPDCHHSLHESYAVLLEEMDEFWDEVRRKPDYRCRERVLAELVHIAAMCQRTAEDNQMISAANTPYQGRYQGQNGVTLARDDGQASQDEVVNEHYPMQSERLVLADWKEGTGL